MVYEWEHGVACVCVYECVLYSVSFKILVGVRDDKRKN